MDSTIQHLNNRGQLYKLPKKNCIPVITGRCLHGKGLLWLRIFLCLTTLYNYVPQAAVRSEDYGKHLLDVENLLHKHSLIESQIQSQGESVQRINNVAQKFIKAKHPEIRVIKERQTLLTQAFEVTY